MNMVDVSLNGYLSNEAVLRFRNDGYVTFDDVYKWKYDYTKFYTSMSQDTIVKTSDLNYNLKSLAVELGLSLTDIHGSEKQISDILDDIVSGWETLNEYQRYRASAIIEDINLKEYKKKFQELSYDEIMNF